MKLSALLLITIVGLAGEARADDGSFCVAGFAKGPNYGNGGAGSTAQDGCAANPGKKKFWHFHGFVAKEGTCSACWDEESSTCEMKAPANLGFRYVGANDCGALAIAAPGDMQHVDPKAPAKPAAPAKPVKPAR